MEKKLLIRLRQTEQLLATRTRLLADRNQVIITALNRFKDLESQLEAYRRVQVHDRVPDTRSWELGVAQQKIKYVEEALQKETLLRLELRRRLKASGPAHQNCAQRLQQAEEDLKNQRAKVLEVQTKLAQEMSGTHALVDQVRRLENELRNKPVNESTVALRRERLTQEAKIAADAYGEDSDQYKNAVCKLNRLLTAEANYAAKHATASTPHITPGES